MRASLEDFSRNLHRGEAGVVALLLHPAAKVPEVYAPGSLVLLAIGLAGFGMAVRMRRPR
jgi:hypothetical protein